jgi:transposase
MNKHSTIIGIDLGDKTSHFAMMFRDDDDIQEEGTLRTTEEAFRRRFSTMAPALIAIEAGTHSPWVSRLLQASGHEVLIANPRKTPFIYANERKTDRADAQMLARMARSDPHVLKPISHRGPEAQRGLVVLKARDALVRTRAILVNHIRGIVKSFGVRLNNCDADYFHKKAPAQIPETLHAALVPLLEQIGAMTDAIRAFDKNIEELCATAYPETEILQSVTGVGALTSLAFALTLEDPARYKNSRSAGVYLGLTPGRDQSGGHDPQLGISKAGNPYLRRLLVGSAQYILGPLNRQDSELRQFGLRLAGPKNTKGQHNKNLKKRAVVAVARKLAVLLHRLWSTGQIYEPFHHAAQSKQPSKEAA